MIVLSKKFVVPMTKSWCNENFGNEAIQVDSGESVVIMTDSAVFKAPVNLTERLRLGVLIK